MLWECLMRIIYGYVAPVLGCLVITSLCMQLSAEQVPRCVETQLSITPGATESGMSKVEVTFVVENQGTNSCFLEGRPSITALSRDGVKLQLSHPSPPAPEERSTSKSHPLLLKNGQAAEFSVFFGTSGPYSKAQCPERASQLLVVLPGKTGKKKVNVDLDICTRLSVSAFAVPEPR